MAGLWENVLGGGTQLAGYGKLMGDLGDDRANTAEQIAQMQSQQQGQTQFQPWTVKSGMGSSSYDPATGTMNNQLNNMQNRQVQGMQQGSQNMFNQAQGMDPRFSHMYNQSQGGMGRSNARGQAAFQGSNQAMQNSMQNMAGREQDIYDRTRAMQRPGEERGRNDMNAGLFGSGRGGMTSEAFGGSPEQHAFGQAQAEARNAASFGAMGQAQQEMINQGNLANQYGQLAQGYGQNAQGFGQMGNQALQSGGQYQNMQAQMGNQMFQNQYMPYEQQRAFGQQGMDNAALAQQGQLQGNNMWTQLGLGGMTADQNYANIQGNAFGNMIGGLSGMAGGVGGAVDDAGGLWDSIKGIFGSSGSTGSYDGVFTPGSVPPSSI